MDLEKIGVRRYLLPNDGTFYKANLHCHSTDSDGRLSPEALVEAYRSQGYSILAITDHAVMPDRSHLCTDDFLVLNGYEYNHARMCERGRLIHINLIAKDQQNLTRPDLPSFPAGQEGIADVAFTDKINKVVQTANASGFLTVYNHMRWSRDTEADALAYQGFFAMELVNYFSEFLGIEEYNLSTFISKLRSGQKIFGIMADDNHNLPRIPSVGVTELDALDTSFGGFIWIKARDLKYNSVISALEAGDFYASNGPQIHSLYLEDGMLHISCSPAKSIAVVTADRRGHSNWSREGTLSQAEFKLHGTEEFLVVVITDENGKKAVSQPYWL